MVVVVPLHVCAVSFQVPLHALTAMVPVVTPMMAMAYVEPSRVNDPLFVTLRYCGGGAVTEIANVTMLVDGAAFQLPDVTD